MQRVNKIAYLFIMAGCLGLWSCQSKSKPTTTYLSGYAQGTTYSIQYIDSLQRDFSYSIDSLLQRFDSSLSIYQPYSVISHINQTDTLVVTDSLFLQCFRKAKEVWRNTGGAFDPTVAPLVNAYGFGFENIDNVNEALLDSIRRYVGFEKVILQDTRIMKPKEVQLDFNALAQGFSVDVVAQFLEQHGIHNYLVEIGGELCAKGKTADGKYWRVGIEQPQEQNTNHTLSAVVTLKNQSLATSGNYRKFYEKNGVKYTHTINPKTGKPVIREILSATIITPECIDADAYATACMVLGVDSSIEIIRQQELQALLIYEKDNTIQYYLTEKIKPGVEWLNP